MIYNYNAKLREELLKEIQRVHETYCLDGKNWIYPTAENYYNQMLGCLQFQLRFPTNIVEEENK